MRPRTPLAGIVAIFAMSVISTPGTGAAPPPRPALKIGVSLALTGPDARWGVPMLRGVELSIEDVNRGGGAGGHALEAVVLDAGASRGDTLSRQHAVTAHYDRLIADPAVVAVIGPQTSSEGRAVAPLLSRADLATITPSSTTFDITAPVFQDRFRPGGRAVYFRTVGTDLMQGEAMARFAHGTLGVHRVALIDDGLDSQARLVDAFARQAAALGMTVVVRRQIRWTQLDDRAELQELAAVRPDAVYVGARIGVGVKLARQIPGILSSVHLLGTESLYNGAFPGQARGTGAEGWYVSNVAPDPASSLAARAWAERYRARFGDVPSGYSLAAYTAVAVVADAVGRVVKRGQPITRGSVRDAIETTRLPDAVSGPIAFDRNGDLARPAVSVYQIRGGAFRHVTTVLATGVEPEGEARR
jgi:branched-chain amino acid transport system substrate-binding protein